MLPFVPSHKRPMGVATAAALLSGILALSAMACPVALTRISVVVGGHRLSVEVAATPAERGCGLSRRTHLPEDQGMLFVFPRPNILAFWMKDTSLPLSIAFLDDTGQILSIQKMAPMQTAERYRSPRPVRYALEVNQGWFAGRGIAVGDAAEFQVPLVLNIR